MKAKSQTLAMPLPMPLNTPAAWIGEVVFWALAVAVPLMGHLFHWNVRAVLPMHWVILLSALVYGQGGGLLTGLVSPVLNTLLTGMPVPSLLPAMTLEVTTYGFVAGSLREKARWNSFASVLVAILAGRMVFLGYGWIFHTYQGNYLTWAWNTLKPGLVSALLQVILLPVLAWLVLWIFNKLKG